MFERIKRAAISIFQTRHMPWNPLLAARVIVFSVLMMFEDRVTLDDFLRDAQTGDVVVMISDSFMSFMQTFWTSGYASHVGIVYRKKSGRVLIYESTLREDGIVDELTGTVKSGPMLIDGATRIKRYLDEHGFSVRWRRVHHSMPDTKRGVRRALRRYMKEHTHYKFEDGVAPLLFARADHLRGLPIFNRSEGVRPGHIFCSMLMAENYTKFGWLHPDRHPSTYCPSDFCEYTQNLPLINGVMLGPEQRVFYY